jgi:hypothetical protein
MFQHSTPHESPSLRSQATFGGGAAVAGKGLATHLDRDPDATGDLDFEGPMGGIGS